MIFEIDLPQELVEIYQKMAVHKNMSVEQVMEDFLYIYAGFALGHENKKKREPLV